MSDKRDENLNDNSEPFSESRWRDITADDIIVNDGSPTNVARAKNLEEGLKRLLDE
jgi:hypothetical protein